MRPPCLRIIYVIYLPNMNSTIIILSRACVTLTYKNPTVVPVDGGYSELSDVVSREEMMYAQLRSTTTIKQSDIE